MCDTIMNNSDFISKKCFFKQELNNVLNTIKIISISTMTILLKLNIKKINIDVLNISPLSNFKKSLKKSFYNSVTFNINNLAIKIFSNGNIHITGYSDIDNSINLVQELLKELEIEASIVDFDIQLINTHYKVNYNINLNILKEEINKIQNNVFASYDLERHMSVKIKLKIGNRNTSIMVFYTGSILISGIKDPIELLTSFNFINDFLNKHRDKLYYKKEIIHIKKKMKFDYKEFLNI
jgi:TATA-box binding protein (TBP) (component of TFIID and TFIIIB)